MKTLHFILLFLVFSSQSYSQQGWYSINTGYSGYTDISFSDVQNGLILYNMKNCLRTTNGGLSFTQHAAATESSQQLYKIFLLAPDRGYAGGTEYGGGFIFPFGLKTTDMGLTWARANSLGAVNDIQEFGDMLYLARGHHLDFSVYGDFTRYNKTTMQFETLLADDEIFHELSFINSSTGWVYSRYTSDTPPKIIKLHKTTNGGMNFTVVFADTAEIENIYFKHIKFFNTLEGIAINNDTLKYTTDGGASWNKFNSALTSGVTASCFINRNTGWIASLGFIHRTDNGG